MSWKVVNIRFYIIKRVKYFLLYYKMDDSDISGTYAALNKMKENKEQAS